MVRYLSNNARNIKVQLKTANPSISTVENTKVQFLPSKKLTNNNTSMQIDEESNKQRIQDAMDMF